MPSSLHLLAYLLAGIGGGLLALRGDPCAPSLARSLERGSSA